MTTETTRAKAKLANLSRSLAELEIHLEPLFSQTLLETLLPLEPLQQAKLQTLLSYVTFDLIFIYLKSRGIDPRTHPIVAELDRIKQYFGKIDKAESSDTKRTTEIDKGAAERFIKHAIAQAQQIQPTDETRERQPSVRVPVKVTAKMNEREQYMKDLKERDDAEGSQEDDLQFVDEEEFSNADRKGKGRATDGNTAQLVSSRKRQRKATVSEKAADDGAPVAKPKKLKTAKKEGEALKEKKKSQKKTS